MGCLEARTSVEARSFKRQSLDAPFSQMDKSSNSEPMISASSFFKPLIS
jgi:hypothetical protein